MVSTSQVPRPRPRCGFEDEDVRQPGEAREVGHHAPEAGLLAARGEEAEDERVVDPAVDDRAFDARRPVRGPQEAPDHVAIQAGDVGRDAVAVTVEVHPRRIAMSRAG